MFCKKITITIFIAAIMISFAFGKSNVITTNAQGEECLSIARNVLLSYGLKVERNIFVEVCSRDVFMGHHTLVRGGTGDDVGGYYQACMPESIWIITGYPREYAIGVIAHELAHAWQSTETPARQEKMLREGFATWCQYKTLMSLGARVYAQRLFSMADTDYSRGLRVFLDVEAKSGIKGAVDYARTAISVQI